MCGWRIASDSAGNPCGCRYPCPKYSCNRFRATFLPIPRTVKTASKAFRRRQVRPSWPPNLSQHSATPPDSPSSTSPTTTEPAIPSVSSVTAPSPPPTMRLRSKKRKAPIPALRLICSRARTSSPKPDARAPSKTHRPSPRLHRLTPQKRASSSHSNPISPNSADRLRLLSSTIASRRQSER